MRRHRALSWLVVVVLLLSFTGIVTAAPAQPEAGSAPVTALVQVLIHTREDLARFEQTGLPAYARLQGSESGYLLAGAEPAGLRALAAAGLVTHVLDPDTAGAAYYLAYLAPNRPQPDWSRFGRVLLADGEPVLLRMDPAGVDDVLLAGVELRAVTLTPKPLRPTVAPGVIPAVVEPDPMIQAMIDQVTTEQIYQYDREFAGELPVFVDGDWYTITTRQTYSGTPIQKAMHYAYERLAAQGLDVEYHVWNSPTNPNVIGERAGLMNPDDIYIIGGHLDDVTTSPGADDNASGPIAALIAAEILSQYQWGCTLRYALWTGEEQGLLGSEAYAYMVHDAGENILGYLNLDMIAWNTTGSTPGMDLLYNSSMPPTLALAQLYADVVDAYDINLVPGLETSLGGGSDHSSFWDYGYTAILAIEDQNDFNPYYHSPGDTPAHTDPVYFTNMVKASVATFAHMTGCLIPSGTGQLDGHVTAAAGGAPIEAARVTAEDDAGHSMPMTTDAGGYYTRTLLSGTYTVTAEAYGYLPSTVSGVIVTTDTLTTQDFALVTAPSYTVSGHVTEAGTGAPLLAQIEIVGSPLTVWTDPADGSYEAVLPPGSYTMRVRSYYHIPEERAIVVSDSDQIQDFILPPTACNLLVDDDQGDNYQTYYQTALTAAGQTYDLWEVDTDGSPSAADLAQYSHVIWLTGDDYDSTLTSADQTELASYLDGGGGLFISGQDIGFDIPNDPFYASYLHAVYVADDTNVYNLTGLDYLSGVDVVIQGGDGANNQAYPSEITPTGGAVAVFDYPSPDQYGGVAFRDDTYGVVYLAFGFEAINNGPDRTDVMSKTLAWLGSCESSDGWLVGQVTDAASGDPIAGAHVTVVPTPAGMIDGLTDPSGHYTFTLPADVYDVTAAKAGYTASTVTGVEVQAGVTTTQDLALQPAACVPVDDLAVTWAPTSPVAGEQVAFSANASGSDPIAYEWDFGDGTSGSGPAPTHSYALPGDYQLTITATNACGDDGAISTLTVVPACEPVTGTAFDWRPAEPMSGQVITFTATATGTPPISFTWNFGDGGTASGAAVTHTYAEAGLFTVTVTATNDCDEQAVQREVTVAASYYIYLPVVFK